MSTPANELFNMVPADPLSAYGNTAPTTTQAPKQNGINPLQFLGDGLYNSGVRGPEAFADTGKFIRGAYMERQARKDLDPLDNVAKGQYDLQYGADPGTQSMGRLIDQMESNLLAQKYDFYTSQGMKFSDAQKRAEYEAKLETDQLMSDSNFRNDLKGYHAGLSPAEEEEVTDEDILQDQVAPPPGEPVDLSKSTLRVGMAANMFGTKALSSGIAASLGVDQEVVDKAIAQGGIGLLNDIADVSNKDVGTLVTEGLKNAFGGAYKNIVYDMAESVYGVAQMYNELTGEDGRAKEWEEMADAKAAAGQAFFERNNIDPEAVMTGMGNVAPMFAGPLTLAKLGLKAINLFRGTALAPKTATIIQSLIATTPMVPYSIGLTFPAARKEGASKEDAAFYATTMGLVEGATEFLPFQRFGKMFNMPPALTKFFKSPRFKILQQEAKGGSKVAFARLRQASRDFLAQGTTELTEETISAVADIYAQIGILDKDSEEVLREAIAPYMGQTVPVSILFGGILGAAGGAASVGSLRRKLAKIRENTDGKGDAASVKDGQEWRDFEGAGSEEVGEDGIDPETGLPVDESLDTGAEVLPPDTGAPPAGQEAPPAASFEDDLTGGETAPAGTGPEGQEQVVQTEATDDAGKIAWGDLGVNAQERVEIEALGQEFELTTAQLEETFKNRGQVLSAMTPAMRKNMVVAQAANNVLLPAVEKFSKIPGIFGGNKESVERMLTTVRSSGDAIIAAALASGDTALVQDIQSAAKRFNRDGDNSAMTQILRRLDSIINDRNNVSLKDALLGEVYDEWQRELVDSEGLLGDPDARASFNMGERTQAVAEGVRKLTQTTAEQVAEAGGQAAQVAGQAAQAVGRSAGRAAQRAGGSISTVAKAMVDDIRESIPVLRPKQQTPLREDADVGINKPAADAVAASLNIQGVTSFDQLQAYVNSDADADTTQKTLAGQVVRAIVNGDAFELVDTKFDLSENVAAVDVVQAIEELRALDPKTSVPIETAIGRVARSKPSGLTQDSLFAREVVERAEKASKARQRSERTGAAPEILSVKEEINSDIYLKTGILSAEVSGELSSALIDDFLHSPAMKKFGVASETELNRALTGTDGKEIRDLLNGYLDTALRSLSPRDVRERLLEIAREKDGPDSTAIEDAIREEAESFDDFRKALEQESGIKNLPNDFIAAKWISFSATSPEDTPRFRTSLVRMLSKLIGGGGDKSKANRMYYGETIGLMQGLAPRRSLGRVIREMLSDKSRFTTRAGVVEGIGSIGTQGDAFVGYVSRQIDDYIGRHPQQDIDADASFVARMLHEIAYPTQEITDAEGNVFQPQQHAADMGKKILNTNNPATNVEGKASPAYWHNLDVGLTDEDIFGPEGTDIPAQYQEAMRYVLSNLGSPRGADIPFMKLDTAQQRKNAGDNIRGIVKSALERQHMSLLQEWSAGDSVEKTDAIEETLETLGVNAVFREKESIRKLEKYTGSKSYRTAQNLVDYFLSPTQSKEGIEDVAAERKERVVPEEALLDKTYEAAGEGSIYENGSALATFKTVLHRLNILPEASVSYEALKTQPEIVRSIFNQAVNDLINDPADLFGQTPEFLAMFEDVYQIEIRLSTTEDGVEFVPRASAQGRDENITSLIERAKQLTKFLPRMRARMHDEGVKNATRSFLQGAYKKQPLMTSGIKALIDNEVAFGDMHQSAIDSVLRFASANAAKQQEAVLSEILRDETKRSVINGHLNKLFQPAGERGGTETQRLASKAFLRTVVSVGSDIGAAVQVTDAIRNIPRLRAAAKSQAETLTSDFRLALMFGRAGGTAEEQAEAGRGKKQYQINASVDSARMAWAEVTGMSQSLAGLMPAGTNPEDVTPELVSEQLRVPITYARAAMRDSSEQTVAYLLSIQTEAKGMDAFATDIKAGHKGALGVLDMLTLGRLETTLGIRMTPGNAELLGRIYDRMGDYKGPSQLLSMFSERGVADVAADLQQAANIEVNKWLKAMRGKMESAEAASYALPDFDTAATAALRNVEGFKDILPRLDPNNMQDFLDDPDSFFTDDMNQEARDAIQYAARTTARGKELLETLSVLNGMYRMDPSSMDPSVVVNLYAATANFFNSEERTKLFNWMGWAYSREGGRDILNNKLMPSDEVLLEKPDAMLQAADLVGTRLGVNMHALNTILTARTSVFGEAATHVVNVSGKDMTVHDMMHEMSALYHDVRGLDTLRRLGIDFNIKDDISGLKKAIRDARKKLKKATGGVNRNERAHASAMLSALNDLEKQLSKAGRVQFAVSRRAELSAALENDLTVTRDEVKGYVSSLVDLGWHTSLSGEAYHLKVAEIAHALWSSGRGEAAISVLTAMPTNGANETLKLQMSSGLKLMDASSPQSKQAMTTATSWRVEQAMNKVFMRMQDDINDPALTAESSSAVDDRLGNLTPRALDVQAAARTIAPLLARHSFFLTSGPGEQLTDATGRVLAGGTVSLGKKSGASWPKTDAQTAWMAIWEMHLRAGRIDGKAMRRIGESLGIGHPEYLDMILSAQPNNSVGTSPQAVVGMAIRFFDVQLSKQEERIIASGGTLSVSREKDRQNMSRFIALAQASDDVVQMLARDSQGSLALQMMDSWMEPYLYDTGNGDPMVGTEGFAVILDMLEWSYKKKTGRNLNMKLTYGDGSADFTTIAGTDGKPKRPGLKQLDKLLRSIEGDPKRKARLQTLITKEKARRASGKEPLINLDAVYRQIEAAGGIASYKGDGRILIRQLKERVLAVLYDLHSQPGAVSIGQSLSEVMNDYALHLMTKEDVSTLSKEYEDHQRSVTRTLKTLTSFMGGVKDVYEQAAARSPARSRKGLQKDLRSLEKTQALGKALAPAINYRAEWSEARHNNPPGGGVRRVRNAKGDVINEIVLTGAWTLRELTDTIDEISGKTGRLVSQSISVTEDFLLPPSIILGAYDIEGERVKAIKLDMSDPKVKEQLNALSRVGVDRARRSKISKTTLSLDTLMDIAARLGPESEAVFKHEALSSDKFRKDISRYENLPQTALRERRPLIRTEEGDIINFPRVGSPFTFAGPQGGKPAPRNIASSVPLPANSNRPGESKAMAAQINLEATGIDKISTALHQMSDGMSPDVAMAWRESIAYLNETKDYDASLQYLDQLASIVDGEQLPAANQEYTGFVYTLSNMTIARAMNLAARTKTPISDIESDLMNLFNQNYNESVNGKYNFMAQFLAPANLDTVYSELMDTSMVSDAVYALRAGTGTEAEQRASAAEIIADYSGDTALGLVEAFNNSYRDEIFYPEEAESSGEGLDNPFEGGVAPAPEKTGGETFLASMASIKAPERPREDSSAAIARVVQEINRNQRGVVDDLRSRGVLEIVHTFSELPAEIKDSMVSAYGQDATTGIQAVANQKTGRVWIVAKNLPSGAAWPVLLHEIGVHIGLEAMIGRDKLTGLARDIEKRAASGDFVAKKAMNRFNQAAEVNPALQDRRNPTANEEIIAYFIEEYAGADNPEVSGIFGRLIGMVRRWAFKHFGASASILTDEDILQLALSSMRRVPSATQALETSKKVLEKTESPAASVDASNVPPGQHNGSLDTGDGVVIDTRSAEEKQKAVDYYNRRAKSRAKGKTMEEANREASSSDDSPFETNQKMSRSFAEDSGQKMLGFVTRWVDGMAPARNAMRRAGQAVGEKYIPEEFNFVMDTVLGTDKHADAENFLENSALRQLGEVIGELKDVLHGVSTADGRKWNDEKIRDLINHWAEAKAAKEHNHAFLMFHAPYAPNAAAQRKQVMTEWKDGMINSQEARRRIAKVFKKHKSEVTDYDAWLNEWKGAGSGNDPEIINGILNANAGAYAAGREQFEMVSDIMRQVMAQGIGYLNAAGHTDPHLFDLYGFQHYMPMHAKRKSKKGNAIADVLTGSGPMVVPTAWGNKSAMILPTKATGGMNGDGIDRLVLFLMNSSEIKAENDPVRKMRAYARKYKGTEAEKYLRVVERESGDYLKITDQGTLARTSLGEIVASEMDENSFVLHENGKISILEIDSNALDGNATAAAIKGNWRVTHPGQEVYSDAVNKTIIGTGRFIASAFTRYNPYFSVKAMFRDSQTYGVTILNEFGADVASSFTGEFATMLATRMGAGTLATLTKEITRVENGQEPLTDLGRDFDTLLRVGAVTTRARLQTQVGRTLAFEEASSKASNNPLKALGKLLTNFSQASEMVGRISAYRAFLTHGMSETEAAYQTKRLMDFSQRGASLPTSSILTVWSLFLRPNLTGAARIIESFDAMAKDNPARAAAVTSVLVGFGVFMAMLTHALSSDNEEDEEKWKNQNPEKMMFGLRVPGATFGADRDVEIPFGYGVGFFFGLGSILYKANITGNYEDFNLNLFAKAASRHFTPFEWTGDLWKSVANVAMPDMVAPFYDLANNQSTWGYQLYKTRDKVPDYLDAKSSTPQIWIDVADMFNTVGEQLGLGHSLSFSPDGFRAIAGLVPGIKKTMDIASLGREGDGIDMLLEGMGQMVGVAGTSKDYGSDAYKDLQKVSADVDEYIAHVNYTGHGASAEEITSRSNAMRIQAIVKATDKRLRVIYKERQALSDSYVTSGRLKDKDLLAEYDNQILKLKMGAVRLGLEGTK